MYLQALRAKGRPEAREPRLRCSSLWEHLVDRSNGAAFLSFAEHGTPINNSAKAQPKSHTSMAKMYLVRSQTSGGLYHGVHNSRVQSGDGCAEAEIRQLHDGPQCSVEAHQHVVRLDVAVCDFERMQFAETVAYVHQPRISKPGWHERPRRLCEGLPPHLQIIADRPLRQLHLEEQAILPTF